MPKLDEIVSALGFEFIGWIMTDSNCDIAMDSRTIRKVIFLNNFYLTFKGCIFLRTSYGYTSYWS